MMAQAWDELSEELKEETNKPPEPKELDHDLAYVCGLLHGIGKVVLFNLRRDHFLRNVKDASNTGTDLLSAEIRNQSYKYHEVGHLMFKKWDKDGRLTYVIGRHHEHGLEQRGPCPTDPDLETYPPEDRAQKQEGYKKETHDLVDVVILAISIMRDQDSGSNGDHAPNPPDHICVRLDLAPQDIKELRETAKKELKITNDFLESYFCK